MFSKRLVDTGVGFLSDLVNSCFTVSELLDSESIKSMCIRRLMALGCSIPSIARMLLRAGGLLICIGDLKRTHVYHMNLVLCKDVVDNHT